MTEYILGCNISGVYNASITNETICESLGGNFTNSTVAEHEEVHSYNAGALVFLFGGCGVGALIRTALKKLPLPYTVWLLLTGIGLGVLSSHFKEVQMYTTLARMDPHIILLVFIPILTFDSAFSMDVHAFLKAFFQIIILAIFGLGLAAFLTAIFAMNVFNYGWDWKISLLFGSIVSATDPVSVVALMREIGANENLVMIIEGESLLNDAAALVLFNVFKAMITPHSSVDAIWIVQYFALVVLGGPALGFVMAKFTIFWLINIFNDALSEIAIILAATYMTFYLGEVVLKVSGVLAVVVFGLVLNAEKTSISPEVETFLHRFLDMLTYIANTVIFLLVGVVISEESARKLVPTDVVLVISLYTAVTVIRAVTVAFFSPILRLIGHGMTWQWATIIIWGGLRGAVGLVLALLLGMDADIVNLGYSVVENVDDKVILHTSGMVLLTLLINGTTCGTLLRFLGMNDISVPRKQALASAVRTIDNVTQDRLNAYKSDRFLADADWEIVAAHGNLDELYQSGHSDGADSDSLLDHGERYMICPNCDHNVPDEPTKEEMKEMRNEARMRLLRAQKTSYMKQFEHGVLSRAAVHRLMDSVDSAADTENGFIDLQDIKKTWEIRNIYRTLIKKLEIWMRKKEEIATVVLPENKIRKLAYQISNHNIFTIIIYTAVSINIVSVITEYALVSNKCGDALVIINTYFRYINIVFLVIYFTEAVIKITAYLIDYFKDYWNLFDFIILLLSFVDLGMDLALFEKSVKSCEEEEEGSSSTVGFKFSPSVFRVAKIIRLLRILRSLRLVKGLTPHFISLVKNRINEQLRFGYEVGKGYVMGEEEVIGYIDLMVDNNTIAKELKGHVEFGRSEILKALGILQKEHPGIAVSVKTQQATRQVLNHTRQKIIQLRGEGILDANEAKKLEKIVEVKMKKLFKMPATIPPPPPDRVISNLSWVKDDPILIEFIKNNAQLYSMVEGEVLTDAETPEGGIYVIVSGLIKREGTVRENDLETKSLLDLAIVDSDDEEDRKPKKFYEYLMTGTVIGEIATLTHIPSSTTVVCETSAQLYHLQYEAVKAALDLFTEDPSLESRMWRMCGMRFGLQIFKKHFMYMSWKDENLKELLNKAACLIYKYSLEQYEKGPRIFDFDPAFISDILLIHGVAKGDPSGEIIEGPCYVPTDMKAMHLLGGKTDTHVMFVIPRGNEASNLITTIKQDTSLLSVLSSKSQGSRLCLQHVVRRRSQLSSAKLKEPSKKDLAIKKTHLSLKSNKVAPMKEDKEDIDDNVHTKNVAALKSTRSAGRIFDNVKQTSLTPLSSRPEPKTENVKQTRHTPLSSRPEPKTENVKQTSLTPLSSRPEPETENVKQTRHTPLSSRPEPETENLKQTRHTPLSSRPEPKTENVKQTNLTPLSSRPETETENVNEARLIPPSNKPAPDPKDWLGIRKDFHKDLGGMPPVD